MKTVALAGGVGAAKLISGLARVLPSEHLTVVVNTGDDFEWMGLRVCPDLDTIVYTLSGLAHPAQGWGVAGDTFHMLERLRRLGVDDWFRIGDCDAATHILRTALIRSGRTLSETMDAICRRNGIKVKILPMTDSVVETQVHTDTGTLPFQEYFVRRRCEPVVRAFTFCGIDHSTPAPGVVAALRDADSIILCPSNPFISIGPILAVPGLRRELRRAAGRVLAVSPVIAGRAVKGPTAAMMHQMGMEVSAASIAELYRDFTDIFVLDELDENLAGRISSVVPLVRTASILMDSDESRVRLAAKLMEMIA
jgi:LPPG:FO 2-phospho-L-lactate transferase